MKKCFKCNNTKPVDEFYKHPGMTDGRLNKCKACTRKDVRENREKNIEYYTEHDKERAMLPHRVNARKEYLKTENGKKSRRKANEKYNKINPFIKPVSRYLNNTLRYSKKMKKPTRCSMCKLSKSRIYGHHWDYSKPLDVVWLCGQCHYFIHQIKSKIFPGNRISN